jgi:hypothetical protein
MYDLSKDELRPVNSWLAGRRYPGVYLHRIDVLHLALQRWGHAQLLQDRQRGRSEAEQELLAQRVQRQLEWKPQLELKLAMRSVGLH